MKIYVIVTFIAAIVVLVVVAADLIERAIVRAQIDKDDEVMSLREENAELRESNEALIKENTKLKKEREALFSPLETRIRAHGMAADMKTRLKQEEAEMRKKFCFGEQSEESQGEENGEDVGAENSGAVETDREL